MKVNLRPRRRYIVDRLGSRHNISSDCLETSLSTLKMSKTLKTQRLIIMKIQNIFLSGHVHTVHPSCVVKYEWNFFPLPGLSLVKTGLSYPNLSTDGASVCLLCVFLSVPPPPPAWLLPCCSIHPSNHHSWFWIPPRLSTACCHQQPSFGDCWPLAWPACG